MTFEEGDNDLKSRWNDDADAYPEVIFDIL